MPEVLHQTLLHSAHKLSNTNLTGEEEQKIEQSRQAFLAMQREDDVVASWSVELDLRTIHGSTYSTSMYKGLDFIQLRDGHKKMVLNRDD